jgi:hypothetical protein
MVVGETMINLQDPVEGLDANKFLLARALPKLLQEGVAMLKVACLLSQKRKSLQTTLCFWESQFLITWVDHGLKCRLGIIKRHLTSPELEE